VDSSRRHQIEMSGQIHSLGTLGIAGKVGRKHGLDDVEERTFASPYRESNLGSFVVNL
jgi:hypothetical protein